MSEPEFFCVQKITVQVTNAGAQLWILNRVVTPASVRLVTDNRVLQPREMNANLVCAASL